MRNRDEPRPGFAAAILVASLPRRRGADAVRSSCWRSSVVFWLLARRQLFSVGALQSMAFQLPELGILSLAMMVTLLSGGLNLSIIATANLCALTMAWVLTTHVPGARRRHVGRLAGDRDRGGHRGRRQSSG